MLIKTTLPLNEKEVIVIEVINRNKIRINKSYTENKKGIDFYISWLEKENDIKVCKIISEGDIILESLKNRMNFIIPDFPYN